MPFTGEIAEIRVIKFVGYQLRGKVCQFIIKRQIKYRRSRDRIVAVNSRFGSRTVFRNIGDTVTVWIFKSIVNKGIQAI